MPVPTALRRLTDKARDQRWTIARHRLRLERAVLARIGRPCARTGGRILSYHSTGTPKWGVNDVAPGHFLRHLDIARELGYRFVSARHVALGDSAPTDLAITFDDGLRSILAVTGELTAREIPFTVFPVTDWATDPDGLFLSWEELAALVARGAAIGSHSVSHPNFRELPEERRIEELHRSREMIGERLGVTADLFAIPFGCRRDWDAAAAELAHSAGYRAVFAQAEQRRPPGTIGRSFITGTDRGRHFRAVLEGRLDGWEEWV